MIEEWKNVKGYEGLYKISNLGRVKNKYNKILNGHVTKGYVRIALSKNRKVKTTSIHRLVAEHFIDNSTNKPYVNHIDGDKQNNNVNNLEWCTQLENVHHAIKNGLLNQRGENAKRHKLTQENVDFIRTHYIPRDKKYSATEFSKQFNVSLREIYRVIAKDVF